MGRYGIRSDPRHRDLGRSGMCRKWPIIFFLGHPFEAAGTYSKEVDAEHGSILGNNGAPTHPHGRKIRVLTLP